MYMYAGTLQEGITASFDLINTVRTATQHLAHDVRKVVAAGADDKVLEALFEMPDGATGQNLRAFCSRSVVDHDASLAALWLYTVVGQYEVWADDLPVARSDSGCQFPTSGSVSWAPPKLGYGDIFAVLRRSNATADAYATTFLADAQLLGPRIDDALTIYRLYKECRNAFAHLGGRADARLERWGAEAARRASDLHVNRHGDRVDLPMFRDGQAVTVSVSQVRCFVSVLFRIAATVDCAILTSDVGEMEFRSRWERTHGLRVAVERKRLSRPMWIRARLQAANLPVPAIPHDLVELLRSGGLIRELI